MMLSNGLCQYSTQVEPANAELSQNNASDVPMNVCLSAEDFRDIERTGMCDVTTHGENTIPMLTLS